MKICDWISVCVCVCPSVLRTCIYLCVADPDLREPLVVEKPLIVQVYQLVLGMGGSGVTQADVSIYTVLP